jgi:hypothetical protein
VVLLFQPSQKFIRRRKPLARSDFPSQYIAAETSRGDVIVKYSWWWFQANRHQKAYLHVGTLLYSLGTSRSDTVVPWYINWARWHRPLNWYVFTDWLSLHVLAKLLSQPIERWASWHYRFSSISTCIFSQSPNCMQPLSTQIQGLWWSSLSRPNQSPLLTCLFTFLHVEQLMFLRIVGQTIKITNHTSTYPIMEIDIRFRSQMLLISLSLSLFSGVIGTKLLPYRQKTKSIWHSFRRISKDEPNPIWTDDLEVVPNILESHALPLRHGSRDGGKLQEHPWSHFEVC